MKYKTALPIFSPKAISTAVKFIKNERPDLWELWKNLEGSYEEDHYRKTFEEIRILTRSLNMTPTLVDETFLMRTIRKVLRSELSLPTGDSSFTKEQIAQAVGHIKDSRPELWEAWKIYEKNGQSFQPIRGELAALLEEMKMTKYGFEIQNLIDAIRHVVFVDAGIWQPDEI
jgi:hypothetical protein